jgi:hypothetical protein
MRSCSATISRFGGMVKLRVTISSGRGSFPTGRQTPSAGRPCVQMA